MFAYVIGVANSGVLNDGGGELEIRVLGDLAAVTSRLRHGDQVLLHGCWKAKVARPVVVPLNDWMAEN
jgi:hypothetical protein